jgi:hypothetical protein
MTGTGTRACKLEMVMVAFTSKVILEGDVDTTCKHKRESGFKFVKHVFDRTCGKLSYQSTIDTHDAPLSVVERQQ